MKLCSCLVLSFMLFGCSTMQKMPLQPGEKIIFNSRERANEFRQASGINTQNSGSVVEVDQPVHLKFD